MLPGIAIWISRLVVRAPGISRVCRPLVLSPLTPVAVLMPALIVLLLAGWPVSV